MTLLLDNLFPLVMGGVLLTVVLAGSWLKMGHKGLLIGAIIVALLAVGLVILDQAVVTEREQIERTIHQIAADVEREDTELLLSHIHPDAEETRRRAEAEIPHYKIKSVRVKQGLQIDLDMRHDPPQAQVEFNVVVDGSDAAGFLGERQVPRFVSVRLWKDGDRWKVRDYRHADPLEGMRNRE